MLLMHFLIVPWKLVLSLMAIGENGSFCISKQLCCVFTGCCHVTVVGFLASYVAAQKERNRLLSNAWTLFLPSGNITHSILQFPNIKLLNMWRPTVHLATDYHSSDGRVTALSTFVRYCSCSVRYLKGAIGSVLLHTKTQHKAIASLYFISIFN